MSKTTKPAPITLARPAKGQAKKPALVESATYALGEKQSHTSIDTAPDHRNALVSPEERRLFVEVAAYFIAEHRGFMPGHESEDWAVADEQIDHMIDAGAL